MCAPAYHSISEKLFVLQGVVGKVLASGGDLAFQMVEQQAAQQAQSMQVFASIVKDTTADRINRGFVGPSSALVVNLLALMYRVSTWVATPA